MKERVESFEVGPFPDVEVRIASGHIHIADGPAGQITVSISAANPGKLLVEQFRNHIQIGGEGRLRGSYRLRLEVPPDTDISTAVGSGDVDIRCPVAGVTARSGSGDVQVQEASGPIEIKVASGDVTIGRAGSRCRVVSASGDVRILEALDDCAASSASGDITLKRARAGLQIKTASGDVDVELFEGDVCNARSVSGDLSLSLPAGRQVDVDLKTLSGRVDLPPPRTAGAAPTGGHPVSLAAKSVSGNIRIAVAPPLPPAPPEPPPPTR